MHFPLVDQSRATLLRKVLAAALLASYILVLLHQADSGLTLRAACKSASSSCCSPRPSPFSAVACAQDLWPTPAQAG